MRRKVNVKSGLDEAYSGKMSKATKLRSRQNSGECGVYDIKLFYFSLLPLLIEEEV